MVDTCSLYHYTGNFILYNSVLLVFENQFKQDSSSDFFNHAVIVTKTYVLTSKTTLFQRYHSTLNYLRNEKTNPFLKTTLLIVII